MALSIKDERADRLVRRYARLHGTTYTGAIVQAMTDVLRREGQPVDEETDAEADFMAFIHDVQRKVAALPVLDDRTPEEIVGYDEYGLPN